VPEWTAHTLLISNWEKTSYGVKVERFSLYLGTLAPFESSGAADLPQGDVEIFDIFAEIGPVYPQQTGSLTQVVVGRGQCLDNAVAPELS